MDRNYLSAWDSGLTRGLGKKGKEEIVRDNKRFSFLDGSIEEWNQLDSKTPQGRGINEFKAEMDKSRYEYGTGQM